MFSQDVFREFLLSHRIFKVSRYRVKGDFLAVHQLDSAVELSENKGLFAALFMKLMTALICGLKGYVQSGASCSETPGFMRLFFSSRSLYGSELLSHTSLKITVFTAH